MKLEVKKLTENSDETRRILTDSEVNRIKNFKLSPRQEEKVRDVWSREKKDKDDSFSTTVGLIMQVLLLAVFTASFLYPGQITTALSQLAFLIVWVGIFATAIIGCGYMVLPSEDNSAFGHVSMALLKKNNLILVIFSKIFALALIALLAVNDHVTTAFVLIVVSIFVLGTGSAAKERVQQALDEIK